MLSVVQALSRILVGNFPCALIFLFVYCDVILIINVFAMRTWRIWFLYFASRETLALAQKRQEDGEPVDDMFWFSDRQYLVKPKFLWKVIVTFTMSELAISAGFFYHISRNPTFHPYDPSCPSLDKLNIALLAYAGASLVGFFGSRFLCSQSIRRCTPLRW